MSKRNFLPEKFTIDSFEPVKKYLEDLKDRDINSPEDLKEWMKDNSEMESVISEDLAWRYIKMTIDTRDKDLQKSYQFFVQEISPKLAPYSDQLNKKLISSDSIDQLKSEAYNIYLRKVRKDIEMFREENIPLKTEIAGKTQKFGEISGQLNVEIDGKKMTLPQSAKFLLNPDRSLRKEVWTKIGEARKAVRADLNELYSELIHLRHQVAENAGYKNFRDYMFDALGRFDYDVEDCFDFHEAISSEVVPLSRKLAEERKVVMKLEKLRPWDMRSDVLGREALHPFEGGKELIEKSIEVFNHVDPYFGDCLKTMNEEGFLDLESKEGKAPGGYNYPLYETGIPFIFMNAVGTPRDLVTMMHEGGHAVHSFLSRDLELASFKSCPSEVAELASMSMELLTMDHWDVFYENEDDLNRAKKEHLEDIVSTLPWIAIIDKFQHWVYENPNHSEEERASNWLRIEKEFSNGVTDWTGFEGDLNYSWQKQLHLFEVPFYYIEYGMAQLGALAIWKNYKEDPKGAIEKYKSALKLGYTRSIKDIYAEAGIRFDFSAEYVKELIDFLESELNKL